MTAIDVRMIDANDPAVYRVALDGSTFDVTLSQADRARLAPDHAGDAVVAAAFRFLLDREPKDAILPSFELTVISRYFPEFEQELPRYLEIPPDA